MAQKDNSNIVDYTGQWNESGAITLRGLENGEFCKISMCSLHSNDFRTLKYLIFQCA